MNLTKIAIVGASGYTGAELVRYLLGHPGVEIACVTSRQYAGRTVGEVFPRYRGVGPGSQVKFIEPDVSAIVASGAAAVFLALPHGVAAEFAWPLMKAGLRVIDLSADFRISDPAVYKEFYDHDHPAPSLLEHAVYGLPEIRPKDIAAAALVASPGCYPTSIILPLFPLLLEKMIDANSIHVFSMSGVSGAGRKEALPFLFCECNESVRAYSVPKHRHLSEIEQELSFAAGTKVAISFTPHLVPVHNGIATTIHAKALGTASDFAGAFERCYGQAPFVRLLGENQCPDTKNVKDTNFIDIGWSLDPRTGRAIIMSAEDNLGKGAGAQAIQSFNLMFGYPETTGLMVV